LLCIAVSLAAGAVINLILGIFILLLTNVAQAAETEDLSETETFHFNHPGDVGQGAMLFKGEQDYIQASTIDTDVHITISGMIARVNLKQHFCNSTPNWQEGIYVFSLAEQAAVDHMRLPLSI
jgi:Ca-activated chloride channel family protein